MKINKFEDLLIWQKARELTKMVYSFTGTGQFKTDYGLKDQIQRSSVSVMSNIAEGFGRGGNKEFAQFLFISKGSLAEVGGVGSTHYRNDVKTLDFLSSRE